MAVIINVNKWLNNTSILKMEWDVKGMCLHLLMLSTVQEKFGYILLEDEIIKKILDIKNDNDWTNRIKPQLLTIFKIKKIKDKEYIYNVEILKEILNEENKIEVIKKNKKKKNVLEKYIIESEIQGFNIKDLLKINPNATILYEKSNEMEKNTIWNIGINLLEECGMPKSQINGFLAKQIKEFGAKNVASAIAEISLMPNKPFNIQAFLIGVLRTSNKNLKGMVSI